MNLAHEQDEPLIAREALVPRIAAMARQQNTLCAVKSDCARRYELAQDVEAAREAREEAERAKTYYQNLVKLMRLLESAEGALDATLQQRAWNDEMAALLAQMPSAVGQELGLAAAATQ